MGYFFDGQIDFGSECGHADERFGRSAVDLVGDHPAGLMHFGEWGVCRGCQASRLGHYRRAANPQRRARADRRFVTKWTTLANAGTER